VDIIDPDILSVKKQTWNQEEVARLFKKYDLVSVGGRGHDQHLLGRITLMTLWTLFRKKRLKICIVLPVWA
jgi:Mg/Co/Ni transporter MgtE